MGPGRHKPDPAPIHEMVRRLGGGQAAFVGDSVFDVETARNAGIPVVIVDFVREAAKSFGADAVIDHFDKLVPTLGLIA